MGVKKKSGILQSMKSKNILMGGVAIISAVSIGGIGIVSVNENVKNNRIESAVSSINVLQSQNEANDAFYQYYVEQEYLNNIQTNLDEMKNSSAVLKASSNSAYQGSAANIEQGIEDTKTNYDKIIELHNTRGYDEDTGVYGEFVDACSKLSDSFENLVNNNEWMEIKWVDDIMGASAELVTIDGKDYYKVVYNDELPVVGKRDSLILRVGGTFTFGGDYYVTNIRLANGDSKQTIEMPALEDMQFAGDGVASYDRTSFNGEEAIKIGCKFNADNETWEEVQAYVPIETYEIQDFKSLEYDIYFDTSNSGFEYKYGGAVSGTYNFKENVITLEKDVKEYSKLVIEGKDVSEETEKINTLLAEIEGNIPKYTTDSSLAEISQKEFSVVKEKYNSMVEYDKQMLEVKEQNELIRSSLSEECAAIQKNAAANVKRVQKNAMVLIMFALVAVAVVLTVITLIITRSINVSVKSFKDALKMIA